MPLIKPFAASPTGDATRAELLRHHIYDTDITCGSLTSPLTIPATRLKELQGEDSFLEMSSKCHISTRDLEILTSHDYLEPTTQQLLSLSWGYHVSIFWLLGYHTQKEHHREARDKTILAAITKRNAIERIQRGIKPHGWLNQWFSDILSERIDHANAVIAMVATTTTIQEHLPLENDALLLLTGRPVFVEHTNSDTSEWGVATSTSIVTAPAILDISENGNSFLAFVTPQILSPDVQTNGDE